MIDKSKCTSNYLKNEKLSAIKKSYYERNKEKIDKAQKEYRENNAEKIKIYKKNRLKNNNTLEYIRNKKKAYIKNKRKTDPVFMVRSRISNLIHSSFKKYLKKSITNIEAEIVLGCSFQIFEAYIASQFNVYMNWENHGVYWEYDHILPISLAKDETSLIQLNHYSNFRPLEKTLNRQKSNKIITETN